MKCPDCGFKIAALPCEHCEAAAAGHERRMQHLVDQYSLVRGAPDSDAAQASLDFALACLQRRLDSDQFEGAIEYDARHLLCSARWWYIPYRWIGCSGFIVNFDTGYVNWLGSALGLELSIWGHERGIFADTVDFSFAPDTDIQLAGRLLRRFKREPLPPLASECGDHVWYRDSEIELALSENFPTFRRHFVWHAIPELRDACESEGLRFTCAPADGI
jgi:hypothetical protein